MNAAHAHVNASLLYKAKLLSKGPLVCQIAHLFSRHSSNTIMRFVLLPSLWDNIITEIIIMLYECTST